MERQFRLLNMAFLLAILFPACAMAGEKFGIYRTVEDYKNAKIWWVEDYHCNARKPIVEIREGKKWATYNTDSIFAYTNGKGSLSRHVQFQPNYWYEVRVADYMPGIYYWYYDFGNGTGVSFISKTEYDTLYRFDKRADIEKLAVHPEFKPLLDCCRSRKNSDKTFLPLIFACFRENTGLKKVGSIWVFPTNQNKPASGGH
jgi:hypothetical protein